MNIEKLTSLQDPPYQRGSGELLWDWRQPQGSTEEHFGQWVIWPTYETYTQFRQTEWHQNCPVSEEWSELSRDVTEKPLIIRLSATELYCTSLRVMSLFSRWEKARHSKSCMQCCDQQNCRGFIFNIFSKVN